MSTPDVITYHVLWAADGRTVLALVRFRETPEGRCGESFRPREGWVESSSAYDVLRNGQDYDLIDAEAAERLAARLVAEDGA